jgi:pantetheine-phosphate adenylyltransferase
MSSPRVAVYTGSFDPFHFGHDDIVRRASLLFDSVVVGIGINPEKNPLFTADERRAAIEEILADVANVRVAAFEGLTVNFAREHGAKVLLRGIRALADVEYEFTMSLTNSNLDPQLETVFLMAHREFSHLSSSLIRQIAKFGGDLSSFVPVPIAERLKKSFARDAR